VLEAENPLAADPAAIRRDLEYMTADWHELPPGAMFEVRAIKEGNTPQTVKYAVDAIEWAVEFAVSMNALGCNIYVVRNPIKPNTKGSASDGDIMAARFLWADCDDPTAAGNVLRFDGPKWTSGVTTGRIPHSRAHTYWKLSEWCYDLAAWRAMQTTIAAHFASDPAVINPSRIMRLAGTITHPAAHKRAKGYVSELVTLKTEYADQREPVTLDQMARVFGQLTPARSSLTQQALANVAQPGSFQIDTGGMTQSLDRERMAIQAMQGQDWHNAVIRLVASYVAKGLSDTEIHALTQPLTLAGYTGDQTAREVQTAIEGARRKGWTPEPPQAAYTPNFDHAPAPTASDPSPRTGVWQVQRADAFTADFVAPEYIIDGIIQRGRIYTLTAPTGSGKTAVMLYAATAISTGTTFCERDVEGGDVLFLAGENPDDVRARVIATMEFYSIDPARCNLHFVAGTFSIRADLERLREEAAKLPNLILVIVDTFAAYFDGDDENSNAQALDFARVIRKVAAFDAKPAVIMPAHPVKNATRSNLSPKGGSSLLNEVDGNLTLWNDGGLLSLHWQGKFRGPEFEPLTFELVRHESAAICDVQGRLMPTVLAKPVLRMRALEIATANLSTEDKLLLSVKREPEISYAQRGVNIGLNHPQKVKRALEKMEKQKLVRRFRTNWELTKDGERAVEIIENGGHFAPEIDP
jgi:hypothetical protein